MTQPQRSRTRFLSRLGAVSLLSLGLVAGASLAPATAVPPAAAAPKSAGTFVALGDSFTAGQGAPPYLAGTCLQSADSSYPELSAARSPYRTAVNQACSGSDTAGVGLQLAALDPSVRASARLVTLTVGGIDAGSSQVLANCAPDPAAPLCQVTIAAAVGNLPAVGAKLVGTYQAVGTAMPNASIAVLNYPRLFDASLAGPDSLGLAVNGATDAVNDTIRQAVEVARMTNPNIRYVDVTQEFASHGIGSRVPFIAFDPADPLAAANFHPNERGNLLGYRLALTFDKVIVGSF